MGLENVFEGSERETVIKPAKFKPADPTKSAVFIFLHGLNDDGAGLANIADQFQAADKLNHLTWAFPTAPENRDAMMRAWYTPTRLTPIPSSRPELDEDEDEDGILGAVKYVEGLVRALEGEGVPAGRVVLGGFSQGHAVTLVSGLLSTSLAGRLGGLVALHGYLPLAERIGELRRQQGLPEKVEAQVPIFIGRGARDILVPKRYHAIQMEALREMGVGNEQIEEHLYEGLGHSLNGEELKDLCAWLERIVPPID